MKRLYNYIFLFLFSFSVPSFADDIFEYQIGGISIGDSLLDHFSVEKIESGLKDWYPNNTFSYTAFSDYKIKEYDNLGFFFKTGDKEYKIYSIAAIKFCKDDIQICYNLQSRMEKEFEKNSSNVNKYNDKIEYPYNENYGTDSIAIQTIYTLDNGDKVIIETKDWATDSKYTDNVSINIDTKILNDWLASIS